MSDTFSKAKLISILKLLSEEEFRSFKKHLHRRFGSHQVAYAIIHYLWNNRSNFEKEGTLKKAIVFEAVSPEKEFTKSNLKLLNNQFSFLTSLLEDYLVINHLKVHKSQYGIILMTFFKEKGADDLFNKELKKAEKFLFKENIDVEILNQEANLHHMDYYRISKKKLKENALDALKKADESLNEAFFLQKLKNACEFFSRNNITQEKIEAGGIEIILDNYINKFEEKRSILITKCQEEETSFLRIFENKKLEILEKNKDRERINKELEKYENLHNNDIRALKRRLLHAHQAYIYALKMIKNQDEQSFNQLFSFIKNEKDFLAKPILNDLIMYLNNFCAVKIRGKNDEYFNKSFEINEFSDSENLFISKNQMDEANFDNYIEVACTVKKFDKALNFLQNRKQYLDISIRNSRVKLNKAKILFEQKKFAEAFELVEKSKGAENPVKIRESLLYLRSAYYLDKIMDDVILNKVKAIDSSLRKSKIVSQQVKKSCLNFLKIFKELVKEEKRKTDLEKSMNEFKHVVCRKWLENELKTYKGKYIKKNR